MDNNCMVSVGIMAYNQEEFVRQTIDCVISQQCSYAVEIVIGDDGSKDNTRNIIMEYQARYPDLIRVLPEAPNKGIIGNFRDIIKACRGKYIAFCHCDDFWHDPLKLQKQVSFLEQHPDYGLVHTDVDYLFEEDHSVIKNYNTKHQKNITSGDVFDSIVTSRFFVFTVTACYHKAIIDKFVDFDEFKRADFMYEDLPTWLEMSKHTKFKYLADSTATYRVLTNSHSHPPDFNKQIRLFEAHYKMKKYFIEKYHVSKEIENEFEVKYHKDKFNLAYKWVNYGEALKSFSVLKSHGASDPKTRIKKIALQFPWLYKSVKGIKKIFSPA